MRQSWQNAKHTQTLSRIPIWIHPTNPSLLLQGMHPSYTGIWKHCIGHCMSIRNQPYATTELSLTHCSLPPPPLTRTNFVLAETGWPLLEDRLRSLAMSFWTKINMQTSIYLLGRASSGVRDIPLEISLMQTAKSASISEVRSRITTTNNPLNHIISPFSFDIQLPHKTKHRLCPEKVTSLKETVIRIHGKYGNHHQFYIDGSVNPAAGRCASAFVSECMNEETQHAVRVSNLVLSTQAELAAIIQSLLHQENPTSHSTNHSPL